MASLSSLVRFTKTLTPVLMNHSKCSFVAVRKSHAKGYWNRDWMPGPYPKTLEERAEAAKKYNMRPEDYEPYPDDGMGYGDYPKLPVVSAAARDPYEDYDIPEQRRNYNEPMSVDFDALIESRMCPDIKPIYPYWKMVTFVIVFWGTFCAILVWSQKYHLLNPVMARQYPYKGKVYYTFELDDGTDVD